jgi:hypothetical protein
VTRIIHTIFVENQSSRERTDLQQPVPIGGVARQPGYFQTEYDASASHANFRNQTLKTFPVDGRCAGLSKVAVDHDDSFLRPTEGDSILLERILTLGAFCVFEYLSNRRLADIEIGVSLQVCCCDFLMGIVHHRFASGYWQRAIAARTRTISPRCVGGTTSSQVDS